MIRVLHFICPTGFYGAERWILALANNIDATLITSVLAVTREPSDFPDAFVDEFQALELPAHELAMKNRFDIGILTKLAALIKQERIDIIHTHGYKSDIIGLMAARRTGIVSISTPHGFEVSQDWKLRLYTWLGGQALKRFDSVAPLSEQLLIDIKNLGVAESKIRYIANGVDLKPIFACEKSSLALRYGIDEPGDDDRQSRLHTTVPNTVTTGDSASAPTTHRKQKRVGYVGQLIGRKNVGDILCVFDLLALGDPDLALYILGEGDKRAELEEQARHMRCHARIHFKGFVDKPLDHLAEFDLFVMTSTLEGVPRCMMESMAMGVPIVAYDIPGVDQLITHNETGLLAAVGDKEDLIKHLRALLYDQDTAFRISSNAQAHVRWNYSARRMADEYTELYQRLLS